MLKDRLRDDLKESLKSGNSLKRMVVGGIMSAIKNRELDKRNKISKTGVDTSKLDELSRLNEEETLEVVASEVKKRKESIESFRAGGRDELAQKEQEELDMLMNYMPEQMSEDEVRAEVKKVIAEVNPSGVKDMGKVIGAVMGRIKGRADGNLASKIVKEELGG